MLLFYVPLVGDEVVPRFLTFACDDTRRAFLDLASGAHFAWVAWFFPRPHPALFDLQVTCVHPSSLMQTISASFGMRFISGPFCRGDYNKAADYRVSLQPSLLVQHGCCYKSGATSRTAFRLDASQSEPHNTPFRFARSPIHV